jgi:fibrillarin-like pre-rRNA processing protein
MDSQKPSGCPNVISDGSLVYSKNLVPGNAVYGERLVTIDGAEYRVWDPHRSKLAAFILFSGKSGWIGQGDTVIYLGASTGTTVSHLSDIVDKGQIYAIEISKRTFRELIAKCAPRKNILPMLGDARDEDLMAGILTKADFLYSDVAQRDQVQIFVSNFNRYRCESGILMLKCRSIDVSAEPITVAKESIAAIRNRGLKCDEPLDLGAFEKDHYAIHIQRTK